MALPNNPLEESQFLDLLSKQLTLFQSNWLCFTASFFFLQATDLLSKQLLFFEATGHF
jgi:hypothetical protein